MSNIKNLDPNNIQIDEKSYKNILIYYTGYVAPYSVKHLHLIVNKINEYIEKHDGNKYSTLVHNDEGNDALKKYEELWGKKSNILLDQ